MFGIWYDIDVKPVKKVAQKYTMKLVRIHLIFKNKIAITANFLAFFFVFSNFHFLDPDPGGKMNGFMRIRIHSRDSPAFVPKHSNQFRTT